MVVSKMTKGSTKMKSIEINLKNKKTGKVFTYHCHTYRADSRAYYLEGVKGHTDYGFGMGFNKAEWERV